MVANVNQLIAFGKYQDAARSIVILAKAGIQWTPLIAVWSKGRCLPDCSFSRAMTAEFCRQATIMIRLRSMVREERPS